jgi:hypothetical protein
MLGYKRESICVFNNLGKVNILSLNYHFIVNIPPNYQLC